MSIPRRLFGAKRRPISNVREPTLQPMSWKNKHDNVGWNSPSSITAFSQSKYSNHLNTGLVRYLNGRFVSGCQMVRYTNGGLKTGLKKACLWFKMSGIWMVCQVMWLYHLNTGHPYSLVFRWIIQYSGVWYSDGYCNGPQNWKHLKTVILLTRFLNAYLLLYDHPM